MIQLVLEVLYSFWFICQSLVHDIRVIKGRCHTVFILKCVVPAIELSRYQAFSKCFVEMNGSGCIIIKKKSHCISVITSKSERKSKGKLICNLSLIPCLKFLCQLGHSVFQSKLLSTFMEQSSVFKLTFSPPLIMYKEQSLKRTIQDGEIIWLSKLIGFSLYLFPYFSCLLRMNILTVFQNLFILYCSIHFLFFQPLQHVH